MPNEKHDAGGGSLSSSSDEAILDALEEVASQRVALLTELKAALLAGQDAEALKLARRLCNLA